VRDGGRWGGRRGGAGSSVRWGLGGRSGYADRSLSSLGCSLTSLSVWGWCGRSGRGGGGEGGRRGSRAGGARSMCRWCASERVVRGFTRSFALVRRVVSASAEDGGDSGESCYIRGVGVGRVGGARRGGKASGCSSGFSAIVIKTRRGSTNGKGGGLFALCVVVGGGGGGGVRGVCVWVFWLLGKFGGGASQGWP